MFQVSLLSLVLSSGILVGPYRVADAQPGHHQVSLRAAMAPDGYFAIAWLDSLQLSDHFELDIYIRFFDKDGNPMTDAYKLPKRNDTSWVNYHSLDMDSLGKAVLIWTQDQTKSDEKLSNLRFMSFNPDGSPKDSAKTLYSNRSLEEQNCVSLANNGEFAACYGWGRNPERGNGIWVQRFNLDGSPQDSAFITHDTLSHVPPYESFGYPRIALNDAGDLVVSWLDCNETSHMYPRYQVFDKDDKPILPWEPKGYRMDDGDSLVGACRPDPCWIDNDRFVAFWTDYCIPPYTYAVPFVARVFSQKGAVKNPLCKLTEDRHWANSSDPRGRFYTAVLPDGRFAETHVRQYEDSSRAWHHAGGILGQVVNDEPWRRTTIFEYSAPFGSDTLFDFWNYNFHYDSPPAVAACNDRLIWVYPRFNSDTIFEAWAVISDWDMGEDIVEKPPIASSDFEIANPIGREIVVRFWDRPQGFAASVFDVSGRKVDELHSSLTSGTVEWGAGHSPGVYFIKPLGNSQKAFKVVLVR